MEPVASADKTVAHVDDVQTEIIPRCCEPGSIENGDYLDNERLISQGKTGSTTAQISSSQYQLSNIRTSSPDKSDVLTLRHGDRVSSNDNDDGEVESKQVLKEVCLNDEEDNVPDGGWGWMVVFGASLIVVLVDTMGQCFGILFSTFLLELNTSTVVTAWIFNLYQFLYNMTGPVLGPLVSEFGWRNLAFVNSIILTIGTITSAFVNSAYVLFLTYSLFAGVGCGVLSNISYLIVPHYFKKRRGLANGIIMAWDCGGQFFGAQLIKLLQDEYSFVGATLILGGIILNCCVGSSLFHPVEWHVKVKPPTLLERKEEQIRENGPSALQNKRNVSSSCCQWKMFFRIIESTINDLRILKSAKAIVIALTTTMTFNGYLNYVALVPFAMQEAGHSLGDAAMCLSISAICNIVARVSVAALSDTKIFNYRFTMIVSSLTVSGSMLLFTLLNDLTWLKVAMAIWGCGVGTYNAIFNLVMIHYMGLDNFIPTFGASLFVTGFGYLVIGPLAGYVRDLTESYAVCIWILVSVSFSSFLLWLVMPAAVAYDLRRDKTITLKMQQS